MRLRCGDLTIDLGRDMSVRVHSLSLGFVFDRVCIAVFRSSDKVPPRAMCWFVCCLSSSSGVTKIGRPFALEMEQGL